MDNGGLILKIFIKSPTSKETQNIKKGVFSASIKKIDDIIFFLFRFGTGAWMDAPYSPHSSAEKNLKLEYPTENLGYALTVFFIDADTGILKVVKLIGLDNELSIKLFNMINEVKNKDFNKEEYNQKIKEIYSLYSTYQLLTL